MDPKIPFPRTPSCTCQTCVSDCKRQPGCLIPGDIERIAAFLGEPVEAAMRFFWASPGATALEPSTGRTYRIGTITPRYENGACVFLENDRCKIYPVAPFGCAYFDPHMDWATGKRRSAWGMTLVRDDRKYQQIRDSLPPAAHYQPTGV